MDDMSFIIRKQRVSELISQNKWSEACFLLRKNLQEVNLQQIEQNSWILLIWLKCCIQIQDYEQAAEVIQLSQNRVISFNLKQNINWLELHQELILSSGIKNNKQACQLLLIWRKLSSLFVTAKYWHQWEQSNSKTLESLLKGKFKE